MPASDPSEPPAEVKDSPSTASTLRDSRGWDGKLRHPSTQAVLSNPEALTDPDYSDKDAPPVEQIDADEDLLDDYETDTSDIDLVHCRITSIPDLHLERFTKVERICLRQNQISNIALPTGWGSGLTEIDLYDNLIVHIQGLDELTSLENLDLSFNKIKHIKNVNHLKELKNLFLVQNRIQEIEGLADLENLTMLELAANRIREIENLEALTSLQELWLAKNKIAEIKNISALINLRLLSVQSNRLTTISGLSSLGNLEELYISHNAITEVSGLDTNPKLRVIDISNNPISHLENMTHLTHLQEFWASYCKISSFDEVERALQDKEELETVYFEGNPLQLRGPAVYRNKIRLALPQIRQIDATYVKVS